MGVGVGGGGSWVSSPFESRRVRRSLPSLVELLNVVFVLPTPRGILDVQCTPFPS